MNLDKFQHAINVVENADILGLPFDIAIWAEKQQGFWRKFFYGRYTDNKTPCCAVGWMCRTKWFQDQGFVFDREGIPVYKGNLGYAAVAKFLEISEQEAAALFSPCDHEREHIGTKNRPNTAEAVVVDMRKLMEGYKKKSFENVPKLLIEEKV